VPGPGPAVGGEVDETPVVTHHSVNVDGRKIDYTATVAQMPLKNASGETEAHIFYMAYTLDGVTDPSRRAVTFCFNGGPGSASMWVHMGGMGPRSPKLLPTGGMPPPPYSIKDNPNTWLDLTDLVFIDPVGTGYSRAKTIEIARRMNGVQGDIQSVGEFMRMYVTRNNRERSPLFIAGESYGTFRAAGLAGYLIERGIAFNGIVLIGTTLNLETIWSRSDDLVFELELPTYAADAWYHKKVAPELQRKDLKSFLKEVEGFALGEYSVALNKGDALSPAERKATIDKLVRYTGLDARYLDETNLYAPTVARQARDHRALRWAPRWGVVDERRGDKRIRSFEFPDHAALHRHPHRLPAHRARLQNRPLLLPQRRHPALGLRRAERLRRHH
jgi:carboxypeptidase C (cathepsin A)